MTVAAWTHPGFESIADLLRRRTGLHFRGGRTRQAEDGVRAVMKRLGVADVERFLRDLECGAAGLEELIEELTVGETYFFRDSTHFDFLRSDVLPSLRASRAPDRPLRLWSAGCASGEEPYSLAILCEEEGLGHRADILATDISRKALAAAQRAVYRRWSLRGADDRFIDRYFRRSGEDFILDPRFRERVRLEHLNLALGVYPSLSTGTWGMDAIFCRNVLIYFDEATIAEVARRLHDALAPDGWLILGPSDPPLDRFAPLELAIRKNAIFYRRRTEPAPRPASAPPPIEETNGASIEVAGEIDSVLESAPFAPLDLDRASDVEPPDSPPPPARETSADERVERNPAIAIRELANLEGSAAAERATAEALARRPFSTELHYLRGALLMSMGRDREAEEAIRRTIYLDRTLEAPHFILGSILSRRGDAAGARRAYRNALKLCRARRAEEIVALADGESAGQLAEAAEAQLDLIERSQAK